MVQTYEKTDKSKLTENFSISEFHCHGTQCGCKQTLHDASVSNYLQRIRNHFGKPITITSGYRCPKHNTSVGGTAGSRHTKGEAADFIVQGTDPAEVAKYAESIGILGIGLYEDFVHIDTRNTKSFWYGHQQEKRDTFGGNVTIPKFYIVTCRLNGSPAIFTLLFDRAAGNGIQRIAESSAAIEMTLTNTDAKFSPVSIGKDTAQIVQVSKL